MMREEIDLIPTEFKARLKLSLNLGMHNEITQKYLFKQIETDRSVQTVWCEYAWKMSVNSKGSTLSRYIDIESIFRYFRYIYTALICGYDVFMT